jgi:hypothetical protein
LVGAAIPAATAAVDTTEGGCNRVLTLIGFLPNLTGEEGRGEGSTVYYGMEAGNGMPFRLFWQGLLSFITFVLNHTSSL